MISRTLLCRRTPGHHLKHYFAPKLHQCIFSQQETWCPWLSSLVLQFLTCPKPSSPEPPQESHPTPHLPPPCRQLSRPAHFSIFVFQVLTPLSEKVMSPHSSTLAWKIPWTVEPGRLQSMGSPRVRHDWETSLSLVTFMHWRRKWQPTPVFLPGESQGWGRTELDTTEVT